MYASIIYEETLLSCMYTKSAVPWNGGLTRKKKPANDANAYII
jgi:hypothetical protein